MRTQPLVTRLEVASAGIGLIVASQRNVNCVAVQSAFHSLEQAVLIHNAWTLEDLVPLKRMVCEVIRPLLKVWLDDNLPGMVERLVRIEIERRRS